MQGSWIDAARAPHATAHQRAGDFRDDDTGDADRGSQHRGRPGHGAANRSIQAANAAANFARKSRVPSLVSSSSASKSLPAPPR
jgi:hypothetical protein